MQIYTDTIATFIQALQSFIDRICMPPFYYYQGLKVAYYRNTAACAAFLTLERQKSKCGT